jgi:hypothetical protein
MNKHINLHTYTQANKYTPFFSFSSAAATATTLEPATLDPAADLAAADKADCKAPI